jgi:hypothetical protein
LQASPLKIAAGEFGQARPGKENLPTYRVLSGKWAQFPSMAIVQRKPMGYYAMK